MGYFVDKFASIALPAGVSEEIYTSRRNINVDYNALDYEIHVATYNEEPYIAETLKSLYRQKPIQNDNVKLILVDSRSGDRTVEKARRYVDDIILTEKGLLTSRNEAIKKRNPDVVLSADAGDLYSRGWIDELAKPFEYNNVVASYGNVYSKDPKHTRKQKLKHSVVNTWNLPGNNSAIRVDALKEVGMFDESIDQTDLVEMVLEEQIFTKVELSTVGKISYRPYASMYKSQRRKHNTTEENDEYKKQQEQGDRF